MPIVFLFIDGVGLGEPDSSNPFYVKKYKSFERLSGGQPFTSEAESYQNYHKLFRSIDACLGVEGLPQSGTGQVTLFSGNNAAEIIDRHFGPFPHSQTRYLLEKYSLFHNVQELGLSPYFMNAYPDRFFRFMNKRNRWTSTTLMAKSAGLELNTIDEINSKTAVSAELTQKAWRDRLQLDVPEIEPEEAADRVLKMIQKKDLVLIEYYLTDKAGHEQSSERSREVLTVLDRFTGHIVDHMDPYTGHSLVITSDHGNIEDLSSKTHTFNPVPLMVYGNAATEFTDVKSIRGIKSALISALHKENNNQ